MPDQPRLVFHETGEDSETRGRRNVLLPGLNVRETSSTLGITEGYLANLLQFRNTPSLEIAAKLAIAFQTDLDHIWRIFKNGNQHDWFTLYDAARKRLTGSASVNATNNTGPGAV